MAYHPCSAETSRKSGALTYPEPLGPPRPVAGDLYFYYEVAKISKESHKASPVVTFLIGESISLFPLL